MYWRGFRGSSYVVKRVPQIPEVWRLLRHAEANNKVMVTDELETSKKKQAGLANVKVQYSYVLYITTVYAVNDWELNYLETAPSEDLVKKKKKKNETPAWGFPIANRCQLWKWLFRTTKMLSHQLTNPINKENWLKKQLWYCGYTKNESSLRSTCFVFGNGFKHWRKYKKELKLGLQPWSLDFDVHLKLF